jgi:hypothetical protein
LATEVAATGSPREYRNSVAHLQFGRVGDESSEPAVMTNRVWVEMKTRETCQSDVLRTVPA